MKNQFALGLLLLAAGLVSCGKKVEQQDEGTQAVGDFVAGFDESGSGGSFSFFNPDRVPETKYASLKDYLSEQLMPQATAASCGISGFSTCSSGVMTRTFSACSFGSASITGTVGFTFSNSTCLMTGSGATVTRVPAYVITGVRGATLTVSANSDGGQRVTKNSSGNFTFTGLGIKRVAKDSSGTTLFDIDTKTTEDISVTGTSRATRVMDGGKIQITNNTKDWVMTLTPKTLAWSSSCNCPVSGSLTGSVTGSYTADDVVIEITGCGTATVTANKKSDSVTMDRCASI